ncbi:terminase small subunit [Spiroplasma endosymbiont of Amphimallon solstitiale]|uniref:terminase small subunit n=1 Tax=Spiroplasma endosymbiont of Amphimallon solstitiale TaxID=3066288 RepID=UPI00313C5356
MQEEKIKIRTIFNDATKLREALENYFIHCKEFDEIPTKVGMLIYLDITENTLYSWKQKKRNTFLQQINWAYLQIRHINTQRYLKVNANNTAWYLERAFVKEYHLSTKIDIKSNDNTALIQVNLENKGKNKC